MHLGLSGSDVNSPTSGVAMPARHSALQQSRLSACMPGAQQRSATTAFRAAGAICTAPRVLTGYVGYVYLLLPFLRSTTFVGAEDELADVLYSACPSEHQIPFM